ncbi:MerR family transcriptional regulator [Actinoplanes siamensis]|uniref:Transcriptional regulator n=1 Tax=Actinoplanes siamensis TaxID=1223317 RepID=A0A919TMF7_9ACTN|nr:MerR family transcriptional regulator [Actinoplanes siamensis]GIF07015.1 transcriptional regulator [Actinoplanes siamensis]
MRISELARRADVPVPTIKFYLREGLLPPGTRTARNQALYDESHYQRLRMIRILTTVGDLDIGTVRGLLPLIDDPGIPLPQVYAEVDRVQSATAQQPVELEGIDSARADIHALTERLGWHEAATRSGRESLARVLTALRLLGFEVDIEFLLPFARAAETVVHAEVDLIHADDPAIKGPAIARSILFDVLISLMLRTARQDRVTKRFRPPGA